jgi:(S)-2-hydroxyglutarate dehydrogenase
MAGPRCGAPLSRRRAATVVTDVGSADYAVIGAGLSGLATALALKRAEPDARVVVVEKELGPARHQSGRNSGVIHSGIYYKPGSLKAKFSVAGARRLLDFCDEHGIDYEICGKVIVATDEGELPRLAALEERARANGVEVRRLTPDELREREPAVRAVAALAIPGTGIVSFPRVAETMLRVLLDAGADVRFDTQVTGIHNGGAEIVAETTRGDLSARFLVNCAGLHADRLARLDGVVPPARIVPFRGEYYVLREDKRHLVRNLVYPVPDPAFPFLGVHLSRAIDGSVHAGPNAVLSLKREGYRKRDFNLVDALSATTYRGFWRLAARHGGEGMREVHRSISKSAFVRSLQRLVPELEREDVEPGGAGVRAQALLPDGRLADDFLIVRGTRSLHLLNAPSPGATSSLVIGETLAQQIRDGGANPTLQSRSL